MKTFINFALSLSILILSSCSKTKPVTIAIIHTNDVHAKLENFDKLAFLKDSLSEIYDTVLLISAGDMFSGGPYVDFYEDKGFPMIDIMNKVGYDLAVMGNHGFDYGQSILAKRIAQAHFPILLGNVEIDKKSKLKNFPKEYTITFKNIPLEFKGLLETENNGMPSTNPANLNGLTFTDPLETAKDLFIKDQPQSILIGLTHLGYETDSILATEFPNIDIIIGGHSHTLITKNKYINKTLVAQAGDNLKYAGIIELEVKKGKLTNKNYKLIDLNKKHGKNATIEQLIALYTQNKYLNSPIAEVTNTLTDRRSMGCLHTDAQTNILDIDFAFQNYFGMRVDSIEHGAICRKDVLTLDPFNNEVIVYNMTPAEMRSLLENTVKADGKYDLFISGGSYKATFTRRSPKPSIKIFDKKGQPLDENKTYKVGLNSYIANSYHFTCADTGTPSHTGTSDNLIKYLQKEKEIDYANKDRVEVITE